MTNTEGTFSTPGGVWEAKTKNVVRLMNTANTVKTVNTTNTLNTANTGKTVNTIKTMNTVNSKPSKRKGKANQLGQTDSRSVSEEQRALISSFHDSDHDYWLHCSLSMYHNQPKSIFVNCSAACHCYIMLYFPVGMLSGPQAVLAKQLSLVWLMPLPKLSHRVSPATGTKCTITCQSSVRPLRALPRHSLMSYRRRGWSSQNGACSGIFFKQTVSENEMFKIIPKQ